MFGVFDPDLFGVVVLSSGDYIFVASFVFVHVFDFCELGFSLCCDTKLSSADHCSNNRSRHVPRDKLAFLQFLVTFCILFQVVVDVN